MYEVRFYKIKDGVLTYTVGYRSFAFTEAFEYYLQIERLSKEEYNYKAFKENNAIAYQRARASISLTTGRLR